MAKRIAVQYVHLCPSHQVHLAKVLFDSGQHFTRQQPTVIYNLGQGREQGEVDPYCWFHIRLFEYNKREEWDGQSGMYTTEGSLGGYGGGNEESRVSRHVHPTQFSQAGSRGIGTRTPGEGPSPRLKVPSSWELSASTLCLLFKRWPLLLLPLPSIGDRYIARATFSP